MKNNVNRTIENSVFLTSRKALFLITGTYFFLVASVVVSYSAECINLAWSVPKTVHCCIVLNLSGDKKSKARTGERWEDHQ